jgi:hypothetical protein
VGLEPDGLGVILQRSLHVAFGAARIAPVVEGIGIVGLEQDGLGVILQRSLHVAFVPARIAPVDEGLGIVGLEPDASMAVQASLAQNLQSDANLQVRGTASQP